MSHTKDHAWGPVITVLADTQAALLPEGFLEQLKTFQGEHVSEAQVYYPPYDYEVRNVTTWLSEELTIGAQSYNQSVTGGPTGTAFSPAVVQWTTGDEIGWLTVSPTRAAKSKSTQMKYLLNQFRGILASTIRVSPPGQRLGRQAQPDLPKWRRRVQVHACRFYIPQHAHDQQPGGCPRSEHQALREREPRAQFGLWRSQGRRRQHDPVV